MSKTTTTDMNLDKLIEAKEGYANKKIDFPISEKELCERYMKLYTGAISDVLREHVLLHQCLPHEIMPLREHMKMAGPAFTVKSSQNSKVVGELETRVTMLDQLYEGAILIWDSSNASVDAALWGGVTNVIAKRNGAKGVVCDGGCRDTEHVLSQELPVFCRYRSPNGSLGRNLIIGYQIPIEIGGVYIKPGDIIMGDIDGVLVIPREIAYEVLIRAEEIRNKENSYTKWVNQGLSAQEILDKGGYF